MYMCMKHGPVTVSRMYMNNMCIACLHVHSMALD